MMTIILVGNLALLGCVCVCVQLLFEAVCALVAVVFYGQLKNKADNSFLN
jgi:hypothetical protein